MATNNKSDHPAKRVRRTSEQARREILDAAERCMGPDGPAGLRLIQVAQAAGVSHPTLLHHFGNREGLVQALAQRAIVQLRGQLVDTMQTAQSSTDIVGLVFDAYRNGLAQRLIWIMQCDHQIESPDAKPSPPGSPAMDDIVQALHAIRRRARPDSPMDLADTRAVVHLTAVAAFGEALLGHRLRGALPPDQEASAREQFEAWFARLLTAQIATAAR